MVHPLKEEELKEHVTISYKPQAKYSYTAGQALSTFLRGLREGKILGRKCPRCGRIYVPPRMYCEDCFYPTSQWVEVKDEGVVMTAVASFISWTRDRLEEPEIVGTIRLFPSSPRDYVYPGLFHRICCSYDDVKDMRIMGKTVRARWRPAEKRTGSIDDIECFEVV
ncbi:MULTISPECIES: Zn-ribbon domain-containing OB-fold protein [Metallosphaera]|uniref:Zn-ribbon domain-containing OB-fold protein n=1 Tax=Metallosphaera TaxID=41980 RepID=UPI001F059DDD|nr:Zn-ribbon domain-containing OB-fold protein [Metallosphaera sedula]MCH1771028.1 Zn-ribbon domain-containing OB-fold protein [Metallosphaera sedula]MCP6729385.1 Zn-ribbon domain-containing OB-fold protein [Metallosphaera sedula]